MGDLNENHVNDPVEHNGQNEAAFNNPALDARYAASIGKNPSPARSAAISREVQASLEQGFCPTCSGSGHREGEQCRACGGSGHVPG